MLEEFASQQLAQTGILGIIVGWFMFRMEKVINNNSRVLEGVLIAVSSCPRKKQKV